MKKYIFIFILLLIPFKVSASICVMDMDTNRLLYSNNANEKKLIASTTKIMTSLVVLKYGNLDDVIEVDERVLKSFGSGIYIEVGEHIKVKDLLYGLMLRSGNDAAIVLALYISPSMEEFAKLMNEYAASLGMENTNFINSSGLEDEKGNGNISTAYDMCLLMSHANKNKELMNIMATKRYVVKTDKKTYEWHNKNKLLSTYKYTTGGKTGYTKKAYRTLVTSASKDNKNVTVVTLDERDDFAKHKYYYDYVFNNYELVNIVSKNSFRELNFYLKNDIKMLLKENEIKNIEVIKSEVNDIKNVYGYISVLYKDKEYIREPILKYNSKKNVIKKFFSRLFSK